MKITRIRGLSDAEYQQVQDAVKALGFASVSMNTKKYALRSVYIKPVKKFDNKWTVEQFAQIKKLLDDNGLIVRNSQAVLNGEHAYYCFWQGIDYLFKVVIQ